MTLDDDKIRKMFHMVHGEFESKFTIEIEQDDEPHGARIDVKKNGDLCWSVSLPELLFEYVTRDWS